MRDSVVPGGSHANKSVTAAFFDLDKTIIASSSALAFGRPLLRRGLINKRTALKSVGAQLIFSLTGANATTTEWLRTSISAVCRGWDAAEIRSIVHESFQQIVEPLIYTEAIRLIAKHKAAGHHVVVLSATGYELVNPIAQALGATFSVGSRMTIVNGHYSGDIEFYCHGDEKAQAARNIAEDQGYDLTTSYAYSDSSTDLPLLNLVGNPHAVNPDKVLRNFAAKHRWPILHFRQTVSSRNRAIQPTTKVATILGTSALATLYLSANRKKRIFPA